MWTIGYFATAIRQMKEALGADGFDPSEYVFHIHPEVLGKIRSSGETTSVWGVKVKPNIHVPEDQVIMIHRSQDPDDPMYEPPVIPPTTDIIKYPATASDEMYSMEPCCAMYEPDMIVYGVHYHCRGRRLDPRRVEIKLS